MWTAKDFSGISDNYILAYMTFKVMNSKNNFWRTIKPVVASVKNPS